MHVLFIAPCFPSYQEKFVRALADVGARVTGIGETPVHAIPSTTKSKLADYIQVRSVVDEAELLRAVRTSQKKSWVDRLEATVEAHILPVARVRETCGIPGTSVRTAFLCRDKPAMKEALRQAGIPCAQSTGANSSATIREFAKQVGLPIIIKPPDGAGAAGTHKVSRQEQLEEAIAACGVDRGITVAVEEFIEGHEGFYDTIAIGGQIAHEFISHYYPNVLHAMRHRWISPQVINTNRLDEPGYQDLRKLGQRVIEVLGIGTSATHMEWFFGPKGLKFSEIGCRPPGVGMWDVYCAAHELDLYREWAMAVVHRKPGGRASRRFSGGMIALRPERDGRISGYSGIEVIQKKFGNHLIDAHFPPTGTPTQPVEAGYWANAWIRMRHPDYDQLRSMLNEIGDTIKVHVS